MNRLVVRVQELVKTVWIGENKNSTYLLVCRTQPSLLLWQNRYIKHFIL